MSDRLLAAGEQPRPRLDQQVTGQILRLVDIDDTGFGIVDLRVGADGDASAHGRTVRCRGPFGGVTEGHLVTLTGAWRDDPAHGPMFTSVAYERLGPASDAWLRAFLTSDTFSEVPLAVRVRVLTHFGAAAPGVIERQPARLVEEAGCGPGHAATLHETWLAERRLAELVRVVAPARWPLAVTRAAQERFGDDALDLVREDPYRLLEATGVRFAHVDDLARHQGVGPTDPRRLRAGATAAVLSVMRGGGHQHLDRARALAATSHLLAVDRLLAADGVEAAVTGGALAVDQVDGLAVVSTPDALDAERDLAAGLIRLLTSPAPRSAGGVAPRGLPEQSTEASRIAIHAAFAHPVSVVLGPAWTARAATIAALAGSAERVGAAADLRVVEHADRLDTRAAERLVASVDDGVHLVLVGDPHLPAPDGTGNVLADLVGSGLVPFTTLDDPAAAPVSRLRALAREVVTGDVGDLRPADGDLFLAEEAQPERIVTRVVRAVVDRAPRMFAVLPEQIQVLTTSTDRPTGSRAIDAALQAAHRPAAGAGCARAGWALPAADASVLARTWPVVVLVLDDSSGSGMSRSWAYGAVTRAERALILIGRSALLRAASRHDPPTERRTGLAWRLQTGMHAHA